MIEKLLKDSVISGILLGVLSISLQYILLLNIDRILNINFNYNILKAPRIQLIILALNILLFRFLMVRWKRIETGKGLLLVLIAVTVVYLIKHKALIS